MNAEQIRNIQLAPADNPANSGAVLSANVQDVCYFLREISAQLAQLNDNVFAITERPILVQVEPGQYPIRTENSK